MAVGEGIRFRIERSRRGGAEPSSGPLGPGAGNQGALTGQRVDAQLGN
jgi:hypothetical protein